MKTLFFFRPAFERYSERALQVVASAIQEAHGAGDRRLIAEHLTLGLIRQDSELTRRYIHGSSVQALVDDLSRNVGSGETGSTGDLPLTASAKAILKAAEDVAATCHSGRIGPLHILGGALKAKTPVAEILISHGVAFAEVARSLSIEDGY
jgi:ATP-dependent Clp protease ATP-binding subunit ClpA